MLHTILSSLYNDNMNNPLILASHSPQRKALLKKLNITPLIDPVATSETLDKTLSPVDQVEKISKEKIDKWLEIRKQRDHVVLTADTLCYLGEQPLGKPKDKDDAEEMLRAQSGQTEKVITSVSLFIPKSKEIITASEVSEVTFRDLSKEDIDFYLESLEWQGAAGAYRIQESAEILINKINGSFSNIMGLPINLIYVILREQFFWD